ncbi:glycosyltransferase family 25 protein [Aquabacterium sp.]|uniref:glycosyltransferase family 25 protein n=1 Tax=Aquabacterium sp. TaxID=1872578 RepID=UPI0035B426B9
MSLHMADAAPPLVLLINLDRSPDRLARCVPILERLGLPWERVPAVEGKALGPAVLAGLNPQPAPHGEWFRPLTPGEIGCFLSHLRCWQLIESRQLPYALILEDDFDAYDACTAERLARLAATSVGPNAWDVLKLTRVRQDAAEVADLGDGLKLMFGGKKGPEDATGYIVSRSGAAKLTPHREHLLRPVDFELKHYWERDLRVLSASPNFFWQVSHEEAASVIGDRTDYRRYPPLKKALVYLRKHRYHVRFWLANTLGWGRRRVLG